MDMSDMPKDKLLYYATGELDAYDLKEKGDVGEIVAYFRTLEQENTPENEVQIRGYNVTVGQVHGIAFALESLALGFTTAGRFSVDTEMTLSRKRPAFWIRSIPEEVRAVLRQQEDVREVITIIGKGEVGNVVASKPPPRVIDDYWNQDKD